MSRGELGWSRADLSLSHIRHIGGTHLGLAAGGFGAAPVAPFLPPHGSSSWEVGRQRYGLSGSQLAADPARHGPPPPDTRRRGGGTECRTRPGGAAGADG